MGHEETSREDTATIGRPDDGPHGDAHVREERDERERFIPFRRSELVEACAEEGRFGDADRQAFRELCDLLVALIHHRFHERLESLKDAYAPLDPDADTRSLRSYGDEDRQEAQERLGSEIRGLLEDADFVPVTEQDLREALEEESLFRVRLQVDFDDFDEILFFWRGASRRRETVSRWFGLRRETIEFTNYDRVLVYVRFKGPDHFSEDDEDDDRMPFRPGSTILKLFRNVPKADLEMLFPNSKVLMRTQDRLAIGVPAAISGIAVVITKVGSQLLLLVALVAFWLGLHDREVPLDRQRIVALGTGFVALGGYLWRQHGKFKTRKLEFMKKLSEHLYFKNLDNNAGVFHRLLDEAEEQESKEAILAYYTLSITEEELTVDELDDAIEEWFRERFDCDLDFDVADAVGDLVDLGLVERRGERLRALPLAEARRKLDGTWDRSFEYA